MNSSDDYRAMARECLLEAEGTVDPARRKTLLGIAKLYNETALNLESGTVEPLTMSETMWLRPDQVDITPQLAERPTRAPDYECQKRAVAELARLAREQRNELLGRFVELGRELCGAESAGISLYEPDQQSAGVFRWHHLSGVLSPFNGATTPRDHSPCGICLDRHSPVLMAHPEQAYDWIREANISVPEVLLIPLQVGKEVQIGTLWVVAPEGVTFDMEHARIMKELAGVASIASEVARLSAGVVRGGLEPV